jgi:hypothetical protein
MSILSKLLLKQYRDMKALAGVGAARQRMSCKILHKRKKIAATRKSIQLEDNLI